MRNNHQAKKQNDEEERYHTNQMIMTAIMLNDRDYAFKYLASARQRWPNDPKFLLAEATLLIKEEGESQALQKYLKCLELDPQCEGALINLFSMALKQSNEALLREVFLKYFVNLSEFNQWEFLMSFQIKASELNFTLEKFRRVTSTTDFQLMQKLEKISRLLKRMKEGQESQVEILVPTLE